MTAKCRHCQKVRRRWRRNLCQPCWRNPSIRARYAPLAKSGSWSPVPTVSRGPLARRATPALTGTDDKVAVMMARALRGESLWHPNDETRCGDGGVLHPDPRGEDDKRVYRAMVEEG